MKTLTMDVAESIVGYPVGPQLWEEILPGYRCPEQERRRYEKAFCLFSEGELVATKETARLIAVPRLIPLHFITGLSFFLNGRLDHATREVVFSGYRSGPFLTEVQMSITLISIELQYVGLRLADQRKKLDRARQRMPRWIEVAMLRLFHLSFRDGEYLTANQFSRVEDKGESAETLAVGCGTSVYRIVTAVPGENGNKNIGVNPVLRRVVIPQ